MLTITIQWWTIPAILTLLSAVYGFWPSGRSSAWDSLAGGVVVLILICVNLAAWLIGALLK